MVLLIIVIAVIIALTLIDTCRAGAQGAVMSLSETVRVIGPGNFRGPIDPAAWAAAGSRAEALVRLEGGGAVLVPLPRPGPTGRRGLSPRHRLRSIRPAV